VDETFTLEENQVDFPEAEGLKAFWRDQTARLRERTGDVKDNHRLVGFIYKLLRDHLPAGEVEELVRLSEFHTNASYANGHLARYAQDIADRLLNERPFHETYPPADRLRL
jgi:hypothetical protein